MDTSWDSTSIEAEEDFEEDRDSSRERTDLTCQVSVTAVEVKDTGGTTVVYLRMSDVIDVEDMDILRRLALVRLL